MFALLTTIDLALDIYFYILIANVVFSWLYAFNIVNMHSPVVRMIASFLYQATEPVLRPIRRILPNFGSIDISPVIVFLAIIFIRTFIWETIYPLFA